MEKMKIEKFEDVFLDILKITQDTKSENPEDFSYLYFQTMKDAKDDSQFELRFNTNMSSLVAKRFLKLLSNTNPSINEAFMNVALENLLQDRELRMGFIEELNRALADYDNSLKKNV